MLKGAQKKMIVVRTRDSRLFEEAYFVMRDGGNPADGHRDMLDEATRIIDGEALSPMSHPPKNKRRWIGRALSFSLGWLVGVGMAWAYFSWF